MKHVLPGVLRAAMLGLALMPLNAPAFSAGGPLRGGIQRDSYHIGEANVPGAADATADLSPAGADADPSTGVGPIRLARFSYVQGNVTWRTSDGAAWSPATVNLPIRQGAQVWVTNGGRAEVQFDDGSLLRLGNGAVATLETLYSDGSGEFTEIQMNEGLSTLELRPSKSIYQVNTPLVSVKSEGPSKVRIGVDSDVEVAVRSGRAAVEGRGRKTVLESGSYLDLADAEAAFEPGGLPDPDSWDQWNDARDRQLAEGDSGSRLPANIALVAGDLDDYGSWHDDPRYGSVWCPSVSDADWRPYQHGHWTWVEPFGWTWVSSESWGWAPYHYGTWIDEPYGWAWAPGPARQYWCPAVVHFSEYNGAIAWAPLCPAEVRYPPVLGIGYRHGDWSLSFSIGGAAVYYPYNDSYCTARPFNNVVVNRVTYINNVTNVYNINRATINRNTYGGSRRFVPFNARNAAGVTTASVAAFGGRGEYQPAPRAATAFFVRGRSVEAPVGGAAPVAGPISVRPTALAYTPSRAFLPAGSPSASVLRRPLFRAALPPQVARVAPAIPRPQTFASRPGAAFPSDARSTRFPGATPGRPIGSRPDVSPGNGSFGNNSFRSRRPAPAFQGTPGPLNPGDRARQAAIAARRSFEPPTSGGDRGGFRSLRPSRDLPGDTSTGGAGRDFPREPSRPAWGIPRETNGADAPREPSRPAFTPETPRPFRSREPSPSYDRPQPSRPERQARPADRPQSQRSAPSEGKSSSSNDRSGGRPGGRGRN